MDTLDSECAMVENEETQSSSVSYNANGRESSLAALVAQRVKVKQEKEQQQQQHHQHQQHQHQQQFQQFYLQQQQQQQKQQQQQQQHHRMHQFSHLTSGSVGSGAGLDEDEIGLLPKSFEDQSVLRHLREMGFTDNREIMTGLRTVQEKHKSLNVHGANGAGNPHVGINMLVEETMLFIVAQREELDEARKMDEARERSEAIVAEEQKKQSSNLKATLSTAPIEKILGSTIKGDSESVSSDDRCVNSSIHFKSSFLLTSVKVKTQFESMMNLDSIVHGHPSHNLREKIVHLLTLEEKAFKWFGEKIPYAYFGITLAYRIGAWVGQRTQEGEKDKSVLRDDLLSKLQNEINIIEHGMYSLSEQEKGDLGLMLPKIFIEARNSAKANGLLPDNSTGECNIIILDD